MTALPSKVSEALLRRSYSEAEVAHLYELGRSLLENGAVRNAEAVFAGLVEVAPDFYPAWMGLAYGHAHRGEFDPAIQAARYALKLKPDSVAAMLLLVACLLAVQDFNSAGTILGEIGEVIESGEVSDPNLVRFYRMQLARFQSR